MNKRTNFKSKRGFTLVEIIIVVVLLGLLINTGVSYMRDTSTTGRTNVLAMNANELTKAALSQQAAGAVFANGTWALTNGSTTAAATITMPATATAATVASFVAQVTGTGFTSYGHTTVISKAITAASYTYTWTNGRPIFSVVSGATLP